MHWVRDFLTTIRCILCNSKLMREGVFLFGRNEKWMNGANVSEKSWIASEHAI